MLTPTETRCVAATREALTAKGMMPLGGAQDWRCIGAGLYFCMRTWAVHGCGASRCTFRGVSGGSEICTLTGEVLVPTITVAAFGAVDSAGRQTMFGTAEQRSAEHYVASRRSTARQKRAAPKRPSSGTVENAETDVAAIWGLVTRVLNSEDAVQSRRLAYAKRLVELGKITHSIGELATTSAHITGVVNVTGLVCVAANLARQWLRDVPVPLDGAATSMVVALVTNIHLVWMLHTAVVMKHAQDAIMTAGHNVPTVAVAAPTATATTAGTTALRKRGATVSVTLEQVTIAMMRLFTTREGIGGGVSAEVVLRRLMPEDTELCVLLNTSKPYPAMRYVKRLVEQWDLKLTDLPLPPTATSAPVVAAPMEAPEATVKRISTQNRAAMGDVEALSSVLYRPPTPPDAKPAAKRRRRRATPGGVADPPNLSRGPGGTAAATHAPLAIALPPSRARRRARKLTGATVVLLNPGSSRGGEDTDQDQDSTEESPATPEVS